MTGRPRILVAGLSIECNSFSSERTTLDDFRAQTFATGRGVVRDLNGPRSELAGAWDTLNGAGLEIVPTAVAAASPGPPLAAEALAALVDLALGESDGGVDGAYVMLHGSAVAEGELDPEGGLLAALRARLGPERPIAISLDHHAHLTRRMSESVDIITAYRTCPHVDLYETGTRAAALLAQAVRGEIRPRVCVAQAPMITPADRHDSSQAPLRGLMELCVEAERGAVLSAALLTVQPWLDVPELGWTVAVTVDGDTDLGNETALRVARAAWDARAEFLSGQLPPIEEALAASLDTPGLVVLADTGDATNGGAPGDSTAFLRAALACGAAGRVALTVRDLEAATEAIEAGPGARVALTLGAGPAGAYNETTRCAGVVRAVGDGALEYTHPAARGTRDSAGPTALVEVAGAGLTIELVVHSRPVRVIDPAPYLAAGVDLGRVDVVQAKSHVSFKAGFEYLSGRFTIAGTAGPTDADLLRLPYRHRPRPLFPFEAVGTDESRFRTW